MSQYLIFAIGFFAQLLFTARMLVQWIASERAKKLLSPLLFWRLSMAAAFLLCIYGWLRNDFVIILGQLIAYYIYIWNLKTLNHWEKMPRIMQYTVKLVPIVAIIYFLFDWQETFARLFAQENIPLALMIFGLIGQFTFTLRFIFQWQYSRRAGESALPVMFWVISLIGSAMIITYAVIRKDPVLLLGQTTGFIVYVRNIMIGAREKEL